MEPGAPEAEAAALAAQFAGLGGGLGPHDSIGSLGSLGSLDGLLGEAMKERPGSINQLQTFANQSQNRGSVDSFGAAADELYSEMMRQGGLNSGSSLGRVPDRAMTDAQPAADPTKLARKGSTDLGHGAGSAPAEEEAKPKLDRKERRKQSHKKVEQRRRERARNCFDELMRLLPHEVKPDKNSVLTATIDYVKALQLKMQSSVGAPDAAVNPEVEYSAAFRLAKVGMGFASIDLRFKDVNEALSDILGRSVAELMTMTMMNVTIQEDLENLLGNASRLLSSTEEHEASFSLRLSRADGRTIACVVDMNLLRQGEHPHAFIFYVRQI